MAGRQLISVLVAASVCAILSSCSWLARPLSEDVIESSRDDLSSIYDSDCYASYESSTLGDCVIANDNADVRVFVLGDSHTAQWTPALLPIAEKYDWELTFYGKRGCSFSDYEHRKSDGDAYPSCDDWNESLLDVTLEEKPNVVIVSSYARHKVVKEEEIIDGEPRQQVLVDGFVNTWKQLKRAGIDVVVLEDTPYLGFNGPDCLMENPTETDECTSPREAADPIMQHSVLEEAASASNAEYIDLTDALCDAHECQAFRDGEIVYRDKHHLTASFAATLTDELESRLMATSAFSDHSNRSTKVTQEGER